MNSNISLTFAKGNGLGSGFTGDADQSIWIRLFEIETSDSDLSYIEAADVLDKLYDIKRCSDEEPEPREVEEGEDPTVPDKTYDEFVDIVSSVVPIEDACNINDLGDYVVQVGVATGGGGGAYVIDVSHGKVGETTKVTEDIQIDVVVRDQDSLQLDFPVSGGQFKWKSAPVSKAGTVYDPPPISYTPSGLLTWEGDLSGIITAEFTTSYDIVDILVENDEKRAIDVTVVAFYSGLFESIRVSPPEVSEGSGKYRDRGFCDGPGSVEIELPDDEKQLWETIETQYYCECSGEYEYSLHSDPPTDDDLENYIYPGYTTVNHGGFIFCGETTGDVGDPEFYEETCCTPPPQDINLPRCETVYRLNSGGRTVDADQAQSYKDSYGEDRVEFVSVSPDDGFCGYFATKQIKQAKNCCDEIDPLYTLDIDYVVGDYSNVLIEVGGAPTGNYSWSVRAPGAYLDGSRTLKDVNTSGREVIVYTEDVCGIIPVYVTDGCTSANINIRAEDGIWVLQEFWQDTLGYPDTPPSCIDGEVIQGWGGGDLGVYGQIGIVQGDGYRQEQWVTVGTAPMGSFFEDPKAEMCALAASRRDSSSSANEEFLCTDMDPDSPRTFWTESNPKWCGGYLDYIANLGGCGSLCWTARYPRLYRVYTYRWECDEE